MMAKVVGCISAEECHYRHDKIRQLRERAVALEKALLNMLFRFENCAMHSGFDSESVSDVTKRYRALLVEDSHD